MFAHHEHVRVVRDLYLIGRLEPIVGLASYPMGPARFAELRERRIGTFGRPGEIRDLASLHRVSGPHLFSRSSTTRRVYRRHVLRAAAIAIVLLAATSARAERATVLALGAAMDATSDVNKTNREAHLNGGVRAMLTFEEPSLALPPAGLLETATHLVPELFAGFISDDARAEGFLGAGLRAELQLARHGTDGFHMRSAFYLAARAKIIGKHQAGGAEFVFGEHILLGSGHTRLGFEGGLGIVKRPDKTAEQSPQLEALLTIYVGWKI